MRPAHIVATLLALGCAFAQIDSTSQYQECDASGVLLVPDPALASRIKTEVGGIGQVTCEDLSALTSLQAGGFVGPHITSLEGLQYARNLRVITTDACVLCWNANLRLSLDDLGPLADLIQLETISLIGTNIRDLSPLEGLSNLRGLGLFIGLVEDISPLAGLTSLDVLDLSSNYVRDIRPLLANEGLGAGDVVSVQANCLDVSVGSESMSVIEELTRRGVEVHYKTQRQDCDE